MTSDPMTGAPKVLAMDVDGVLVHPTPDFGGEPWDSHIAADLGIDPDALSRLFFKAHWRDVVVGRRGLRETLGEVLPELNPQVSVDEFIQYWFTRDAHVDESVADELRRWRSRPGSITAAITNQEKLRVEYLREIVGFDALFDHIVWSGMLGITKSDPAFYTRAQEILDVEPGEIIFFDDDQPNVDLARAAGWRAYFFESIAAVRSVLSSPMG